MFTKKLEKQALTDEKTVLESAKKIEKDRNAMLEMKHTLEEAKKKQRGEQEKDKQKRQQQKEEERKMKR